MSTHASEPHGHVHGFFHGLGSTVKWSFRILGLVILLVIVIAVINLGSAANKSEQSSKQVTPAKYQQVHNGMTQSELRSLLGKPERTDTQQIQGLGSMGCSYYGILAQSGTYQFCFQNGKLNYKARYG